MKKNLFLSLHAMIAFMLFIAIPSDADAQGRNRNYIKERIRINRYINRKARSFKQLKKQISQEV